MSLCLLVFLCFSHAHCQQSHHNPALVAEHHDAESLFQFVTRPDIEAPKWDITIYDQEALAPGYWFLAPYANLQQTSYPLWNGPHIYDQNGDLIWSGAPHFDHRNVYDFRVSIVNDTPMLTANFPHNFSSGNAVILDETYNTNRLVDMVGNNSGTNMHDFNLIDNGKRALFLTAVDLEEMLVSLPWFNGICNVGWQGFKEVDVDTGEVVFEWNAKDHISLSESTFLPKSTVAFSEACMKEWDITHFNAIDKFDDGDYLLSARHTDTLYKVSPNGSIVWGLGGKQSDFHFTDERAKFSRQHHARVHEQNATHAVITVFDNAIGSGNNESASSGSSWGLLLALRTNTIPMTADFIARYEHPNWNRSRWSPSRGSMQLLPNGNAFVGWVFDSLHSEYSANGRLLMQANLRLHGTNTYRSYKFPWTGRPTRPPDVKSTAFRPTTNNSALNTVVYVSWNGATEVATWNLLHTSSNGRFSEIVASSPRQGFETQLRYDGFAKYVVAVGLDSNGKELGRSEVMLTRVPPGLQSKNVTMGEMQWAAAAQNQSWQWSAPTILHTKQEGRKWGWGTPAFALGITALVVCMVRLMLHWSRNGQESGFGFASKFRQKGLDTEQEAEQREWMLADGEIRGRQCMH